jgi:hypothetical protein
LKGIKDKSKGRAEGRRIEVIIRGIDPYLFPREWKMINS